MITTVLRSLAVVVGVCVAVRVLAEVLEPAIPTLLATTVIVVLLALTLRLLTGGGSK